MRGIAFLLLLLAGFAAAPAAAAPLQDESAWAPFAGCWQLVEERSRNDQVTTRTCITAGSDAGTAVITTELSDQTTTERTLRVDGVEHPLQAGACRGTERAEWSSDRRRLFRTASLSCAGDPATRHVSGLRFLVNDATMLEIEAAGANVEVRRFFREGGAPQTMPAPFTLADVREASGRVSALVLEAAIVESHSRYALNGRTLLDLDAAGVPDSVIDLMVAVSYPQHFIVDRPGVPPGRISGGGGGGGGIYGPGFGSYSSAEFPFSLWDPYGYYGYWSPYRFYVVDPIGRAGGWSLGGWSVETGTDGGSAGGGSVVDGRGVAVNGQGYTRVRTASEVAVSRGATASTVSGHVPPARTNAGSGGSGGSVSSSGYSSGSASSSGSDSGGGGGGGGDGGRTAVPR
jgi:hypothetical protein